MDFSPLPPSMNERACLVGLTKYLPLTSAGMTISPLSLFTVRAGAAKAMVAVASARTNAIINLSFILKTS